MEKIVLTGTRPGQICNAINQVLGSTVEIQGNTSVLLVKNSFGKGWVRCVEVRDGISFVHFDIHLNKAITLVFCHPRHGIGVFLCLFEGNVSFLSSNPKPLSAYQTTIIGGGAGVENSFQLAAGHKIKISFLMVDTYSFEKKQLHKIEFFTQLNTFYKKNPASHFEHFGYLNIAIGEQTEFLNRTFEHSDVSNLYWEGQILVIMSGYIETFLNYENHLVFPEFLTEKETLKIYDLSRYIRENISEKITIRHLAQRSGMNPHKLQSGFSVLFDCTVNEYVRQKKMEIALECLNNNELSISEIVYKIGWKSKSYFSKVFLQKYGMLPVEYRKTHQRLAKQAFVNGKGADGREKK